MAYSINGKVYTDHPLMDEIVYNCKQILQGIVIKNDVLANDSETEESLENSEVFIMIKDGSVTFNLFPFTSQILSSFGYNSEQIRAYLLNKNNIPESDREELLSFSCNYFLNNYEETNNYYRSLIGLPNYGTNEYNIYIDSSYIPNNYDKDVDFTKPLHEQDSSVLAILEATGKLEEIISNHRGSHYSYLRFLGDKKIDLYTARKANKWDILYMPSVEALVEDRFREIYSLNRDMFLKRTYQEAYAFNSTYYEQCMILMVLCQTFNDMIVDVPEWYIRRDIFDIRSVQYFLESYGVEYFKEIPLKYQIKIVKNLNKLIKYKSSNRNNNDILEIFSLDNTAIYKYYLYKKRKTDGRGNYLTDKNGNDVYDLEFVQCKFDESYDNYIKDMIYRTPYDDITYQDKYWDGEDEHSYIKSLHMQRDFTIEGTKYMSIEYKIPYSEYLFQMSYFLSLLLDSNMNSDDIKIAIPSIQSSVYFRLSDLFIFLFLLTNGYYDCDVDIIKPDTDTSGKIDKPTFKKYDDYDGGYSYTPEDLYSSFYSLNNGNVSAPNSVWQLNGDGGDNVEYSELRNEEDLHDWMKKVFPELFIESDHNKVYGFNLSADLTKLEEIIGRKHSNFQFEGGFSLKDFGVDNFNTYNQVSTIDEFVNIYNTNKECYDKLLRKMADEVDNRDQYKLMQFVFDYLFTKPFDYSFYKLSDGTEASSLKDILKDRDFILYNVFKTTMSETNVETRQDNIRNIMNDVINTLEYYLSYDGLDYIFSFATVSSFNSLVNYIYLMINFFKSYKVHFLDPYITFVVDNRLENSAEAHDSITERKLTYFKEDKAFSSDIMDHKVTLELEDRSESSIATETLDIYGHFEGDPKDDYDYDGMYASSDQTYSSFKDANGGYADDYSCIPYIVLNGGAAQGSKENLWDLNGATAVEMQDYVDVDGGPAVHREDWRQDYWGSAFTYIIDGGSASTNQFLSSTMHTRVVDRQIESSVRIATKAGNKLVETEDGLYLQESWVAWSDFEDFATDTKSTFDYFSSSYARLISDIEVAQDEELLDQRIQNCIENYIGGMRKVVEYMENDSFEKSLKDYTDQRVNELYAEFYGFSPFKWDNF